MDSIRETYFAWEDQYYNFLDSLDAKGIPVYKIVEPIDKILPSFALLLVVAVLLLIGIAWLVSQTVLVSNVPLIVEVLDSQDNPLPGVTVLVKVGEQTLPKTSGANGKTEAFDIPSGSRVKIVVDRQGFNHFESELFLVEKAFSKTVRLQAAGTMPPGDGESVLRSIRIVTQSGQLVLQPVQLVFSCINTTITPPPSVTVTTGTYQVLEPANCNGLIARVSSTNFQTLDSQPIVNNPQTIFLSEIEGEIEKGNLEVTLLSNDAPVTESIMVGLYDSSGSILVGQQEASNGIAEFLDLNPGVYLVRTVATQTYGSATASNVSVASNQTRRIEINLEQNIAGFIKIKVVRKGTNSVIENASVVLQYNNVEVARKTTSSDNNGFVTFYVSEEHSYDVVVDAEGYCLANRSGIEISTGTYVIELEPFTASCGGTLIVKVVDQDGKAVSNASVALANEDQFFIGTSQKLSDINGTAKFSGVPSGTYRAFSSKGTISGWSDASFFSKKAGAEETVDLIVTMQIPNGTLSVQVVDKEGNGIPFATIFFMDSSNNTVFGGGGRPTDGMGLLNFETRADKKVFLVVQKEGFASFVSPEYTLTPSAVQQITVVLLPPITKFEVELLGLYQGNLSAPVSSNRSSSLVNGQEYVAKFRVKIPEENFNGTHKASEIGLHVRTGDDTVLEKDLLFLKQSNIPQASVLRGTSFTGDAAVDAGRITNGDAKWLNAVWLHPLGSVLEADVVVKVKPSAALGKRLNVWYRGWMRVGSSTTRDPVDSSGSEHELYSDAKLASYLVGMGTLCDETFCFEASVFDPEKALKKALENNSFTAKTKHLYTLDFSVSNVSARDIDSFQNAELRIRNPEESILLKEYTIFDASSQGSTPISGNANAFELPRIDIGDLSPGRQFSGTLSFFTEKVRSGTIVLEVVDKDRQEIVFSREIQVLVSAEKQLNLVANPDTVTAGIENKIVFTVTNKETQEPVQNAVVSIRDRFDTLLTSATTNSLGNTEITLPGQAPGESLFAIAEKPDYNSAKVEIGIDSVIAKVEPKSLGYGLNARTKPSETKTITITNLSKFPLIVNRIFLDGKFYGLLEADSANSALSAFEGMTIEAGEELEVAVPISVSRQAEQLTEPANLSGLVTVELANFGRVWIFDTALNAVIGLGGEVDDPNCLTLSQTEWIASTEGKPVSIRFEIQNNCSASGKPVAIQEIEAKLQWETNPAGNFELVSSKSHSVLRTGYFKTVLPSLAAEQSESVTLTFTPNGATLGKVHAIILFQATNPSDAAPQILSAELDAQIEIVSILDCISISKNELEMTANLVFAPQTTGFGQLYNTQLFEGDFEDTDYSQEMGGMTTPGMGFSGVNPYFNNGLYSGYNPSNYNYGSQPGFSPAYGGNGFSQFGNSAANTGTPNPAGTNSPITGNQLLGMPTPGFGMPGGQQQSPQDSFTIQAQDCGGPVSITLESELRLSTTQVQLNDDSPSAPIIVFGEEKYPGQYGIKILVQGGGNKNPKQLRTLAVVLHSNPYDCIQMNKFEFNIFKESENAGVDTGRVYNYCFDKPVPVLIDKHDLDDALKHGEKTAALGLMMGLMSELMKGDLLSKLKNPDSDDDDNGSKDNGNKDEEEENPCGTIPSNAKCEEASAAIQMQGGTYGTYPVLKIGNKYFGRKVDGTLFEVKKDGSTYTELPKAAETGTPPAGAGSTAAPNQSTQSGLTGFQIFGLPYVQESEGFEETGNPQIDEQRREDAQELADLQVLPVMVSMMGGGNDPFTMALMMYAMGTIQAYNSQEDTRLLTIQPDIELGGGILGMLFGTSGALGGGGFGGDLLGGFLDSILPFNREAFSLLKTPAVFDKAAFEGVSVSEYRRPTFSPRRDNQALSMETAYIKIENTEGIVQEDPLTPLYAVLNVDGKRHMYDKDQAYKKDMPNKLREKGTYSVNAKFHLQFNSFKPDTNAGTISNELANCKIGPLIGSTGMEAVPRVKFAWNWNDIAWNECDSDNPDYVYCDATQFSISLLKKTQLLREFITANADLFECPPLISGEPVIEQTLSTIARDIGLTKLEFKKSGEDINFLTTIASNNQLDFNTTITTIIQKTDENGIPIETVHSCSIPTNVLTTKTVACLAPGLENGTYLVTSSLGTVANCPNCGNDNLLNDAISKTMLIGLDQTLVQCEPIETARLKEFIEATEASGKTLTYPSGLDKEKTLRLANFTSHLIKDGYTQDFRSDFDSFATTKAFFQTPAYYSQQDGLGEIFSDSQYWTFEYYGSPNGPIAQPGIYKVKVNVQFKDTQFEWFSGGTPVVEIEVSLDKTSDASPTSPFYYLPFDGAIGIDSGRNGYGLNYELLTADKPIQINRSSDQTIQLNNILASNPVSTLKGRFVDDFTSTNYSQRGMVLSMDRVTNELRLFPSLATPVILKVNATSARDAYAFYRLEASGQPQTAFDYLATWNGLGVTCKDYFGNDMEIYSEMPDKSGTEAQCAIVGSQSDTAFGFEWCNKIKSGNLFLETVFYSPASSQAVLQKVAASNDAALISVSGSGSTAELIGTSGIPFNSSSSPIATVQDVLDLVKQEKVCISGLDNSQKTEFFWNPKPVLESLQNERDAALTACISG